jgi:hypothetical protein
MENIQTILINLDLKINLTPFKKETKLISFLKIIHNKIKNFQKE